MKRTHREAGKVVGIRLTPAEVDQLNEWIETLDETALARLRDADPRPDDERGRRVVSQNTIINRAIWHLGLQAARQRASGVRTYLPNHSATLPRARRIGTDETPDN